MSFAGGQLGEGFAVVAADLRWGMGEGSSDIEGEPWADLATDAQGRAVPVTSW